MSLIEERRARWIRLVADQKASGLSMPAWCREQGVSVNTFYGWRHRLAAAAPPAGRKIKPAKSKSVPEWLSVSADPAPIPPSCASLTLRVGVVSIDVAAGFDASLLKNVLSVLEARC